MIHNRTMIEPKPAPSSSVGPVAWLRSNLFNGPINTIFTLIGLYILYLLVVPTVQWAFINADWVGTTRDDCSREGACWVFINARFTQFIYGLYPRSEIWRANIVFAGFFTLIAWLAIPRLPFKHWVAVFALVGFPVIAYVLLHGGYFDLPRVPTHRWGGLQSFTADYLPQAGLLDVERNIYGIAGFGGRGNCHSDVGAQFLVAQALEIETAFSLQFAELIESLLQVRREGANWSPWTSAYQQ